MKTILDYEHGLHRDVADEVYHSKVKGLASKHALDRVRRSPAHYLAWLGETEKRDTAALAFGKAFETCLLEPQRFEGTYIVEPDFGYLLKHDASGTTAEQGKANKERKRAWEAEHAGALRMTAEDYAAAMGMAHAIRQHPTASKLLSHESFVQVTLRWKDPTTGLECKARPDLYIPDLGVIVDLKTAEDASEQGFITASSRFGYHRQDAMYRDAMAAIGMPVEHFLFLMVEKESPHAVGVYNHCEADVERGRVSINRDLARLAEAIETDNFGAYSDGIVTVELRAWAA